MHLLAAAPGQSPDTPDPVDLGQSPGDVVILSAADTELAALANARAEMPDPPALRLANLSHLAHPMSVDLHLDTCATRSRLVIIRLLGGASYWRYGLTQYAARLAEHGIPFVPLPGDDKPDPDLAELGTVGPGHYHAFWAYFTEGGPGNMARLLAYTRHFLDGTPPPEPAAPLLRAGLFWPGMDRPTLADIRTQWPSPAASPQRGPEDPGGMPPGTGPPPPPPAPAGAASETVAAPRDNAHGEPVPQGVGAPPVVPILFYRALLLSGDLAPIARLTRALLRRGLAPLPVFVASLKDPLSRATLSGIFGDAPPSVILNATAFATGTPETPGENPLATLEANRAPVLQVILSTGTEDGWRETTSGLSARDIAMSVALPEVDGRLTSRAISFKAEAAFDPATECPIATHRPLGDRIDHVADLAGAWATLRATPPAGRKIAIILANYPNRDGRLANGVGLDTPASVVQALQTLAAAGYTTGGAPPDPGSLMDRLLAGPTNWLTDRALRRGGEQLPVATYKTHLATLPWASRQALSNRWGAPEDDPFADPARGFALSIHRFGNIAVGLQPARGYNIDPAETYHSPDLIPPHNYLAFYKWLERWGAHAIVHMGKHGNLEWLPGKALALSRDCWPEIALPNRPHIYPFIVNDPGEGSQAKRRTAAVILDHLTPPLTRAETYGPLAELETLMDEYAEAQSLDPRRAAYLAREILTHASATGLDRDAGLPASAAETLAPGTLQKLDSWLCDLKEAQIRDGLHIFGQSPAGLQARDLVLALARLPRGDTPEKASLLRALAQDLALTIDPLDCDLAAPPPERPDALTNLTVAPWRTNGDTIERLELLTQSLTNLILPKIPPPEAPTTATSDAAADGAPPRDGGRGDPGPKGPGAPHDVPGPATRAVLDDIATRLAPAIAACGPAETRSLLDALNGYAIAPGPSGAPTRGRPDVLPTGRNFYSVDTRAVPTRAAWTLGWRSANLLIERHLQDQGDWPRSMLLTCWGTANMRTGGDDIAQALALMGVKPTWDDASARVTGTEIIPLTALGRPRVDVTLRISGFFRDAFPGLVALVDAAARTVQSLDEPADMNPAAAKARRSGAGPRIYGAKPGAYGAGLQAMIDERLWESRDDLAEAYLTWGSYAYGRGADGAEDRQGLEDRLKETDAVVQNQDNREHDLLDSDDYYQFEGGAAAAVASLRGEDVPAYHNDHARPERPVIRTLDEEIARVIRSRAVNPKWIEGVKRHGYKGAFEIAATVDYLFAFAATTRAVANHHFDLAFAAYLDDDATRSFIAEANPAALSEIARRFQEAIDRRLWTPASNSARVRLAGLLAG